MPTPSQRNIDIHRRYRSGESTATLAMEYGISRQRVYQIVEQVRAFLKAPL